MKVMTIVGTRPEIIRLSRIVDKLDKFTQHVLVHTGQNYDYELNEIFFKELEIRKPDYFLEAAGINSAQTIGNVIIKTDEVLEKEKPDALLVLGDTNSSLSVIPAKRRRIPIFHMEAGNRCYDLRVPEEINRKIVDHTADINLPYSNIAREYLLREGFPPEQIIKTGSPMYEVLDFYRSKIERSDILTRLCLQQSNYFVLSIHREENVDSEDKLKKIACILNEICDHYGLPIIFSTHPRTRNRLESYKIKLNPLVQVLKPLGFIDYVNLQMKSLCVISDSGTITEESSIMNFTAITLREVHERPEGMEEGVVIMTGLDNEMVLNSIQIAINTKVLNKKIVEDYLAPDVSTKILKIIMSYTGFINRRIWKKNE